MELMKCLWYLFISGLVSFGMGRLFPRQLLRHDAWPFRAHEWEKGGRVYERLAVRRWQNRLPDMSHILPGTMPAKRIETMPTLEKLMTMVEETCVAELVHLLLCVSGLRLLKLWRGPGGLTLWLLYVLIGNVPYIIMQRYNRPRFLLLMKKLQRRLSVGEQAEGRHIACGAADPVSGD